MTINILVTGGNGYIGEYIVRELKNQPFYKVFSIDNNSKFHKPAYTDSYEDVVQFDADCRDEHELIQIIANNNINVVIAGAALIGGIKYFHDIPYDILSHNNDIMRATINASNVCGVQQLILISSSMVYESAIRFPVREGDERLIAPPVTSYGFQKLSTEYYVRAACEQYKLNYTILRPFNAAGPGEEAERGNPGISHVLPDFILKAQEARQTGIFEILGDGTQIRCLTHCTDIARAVRLAILNPKSYEEDFNIVNHDPITMLDLARMVIGKMCQNQVKIIHVPGFTHDVKKRVSQSKKALHVLLWRPIYTLENIVDEMVKFS